MAGGNIFLVGMMGAGKTTVGKALARKTGREFVDSDRVLVERTGVPIATIFEIEGEAGTVVYLRARIESLWERTRHDTTRPLLATPDPRKTLAELLEMRDPLYREAAHVVVDTGAQSAATLAARVLVALGEHDEGVRELP